MKLQITLIFLCIYTFVQCQNNYIYNGGTSQGFDFTLAEKTANNSIFSGGSKHGFDAIANQEESKKWYGGIDDGWAFGVNSTVQNQMYDGGMDDGMAYAYFEKKSKNLIVNGGVEDGFSYDIAIKKFSELVHAGGVGDGFSHSGISKLIWDGDISKDWLMADNWNIPIVPTMNHAVCIPDGMPRYPKLSNILGISISDKHTYACESITVLDGAIINGIEGVKFIVNGELTVFGEVLINTTSGAQIEGRNNGIIEVKSGGQIRVE